MSVKTHEDAGRTESGSYKCACGRGFMSKRDLQDHINNYNPRHWYTR